MVYGHKSEDWDLLRVRINIVRQNRMNISFFIECKSIPDFLSHWGKSYYDEEWKYDNNIGKPLTEQSRLELFEWKNGSRIAPKKLDSIRSNYPLAFNGDLKNRYLNTNGSGGAIWNIFYMHCIDRSRYPIYDQHTYRAMRYIQTGKIDEISDRKSIIYSTYQNDYIPFVNSLKEADQRKIDKALFSFGQFLKKAKKYV